MGSMRDTLLRLFPPGTDIEEFVAFFRRVGEREFQATNSIETSSHNQSNEEVRKRKFVIGTTLDGKEAVADYHYQDGYKVILLRPSAWMAVLMDSGYFIRIRLLDGKIADLTIQQSHTLW